MATKKKYTKIDLTIKKPSGNEQHEVAKFKATGDALISANALGKNAPSNYEYSVSATNKYAKGGGFAPFRISVLDENGRENYEYFDDETTAYEKFIEYKSDFNDVALEKLEGDEYETITSYNPDEDNEDNYSNGGGVGDINMEFLKVFRQYGFINSYSYGHNVYENKNKDIIVFSPKSDTIGKGWLTLQLSNNMEERLHLKPFTTSALIDLFNKYGLLPTVNKGELSYTLYSNGGGVGSKSAKKIKIESYLPVFTGFYNTIFEPNEEMYIEDGYDIDDYDFDYEKYRNDMGEACSDAIQEQLEDFEVKVKFQSVNSPQYYNYSNDSFDVEYTVTPSGVAKINSYLKKNRGAFEQYLKDNYTSRDGFMSGYSNNADVWFEDLKNAKKIGHIFGSILEFILQNEGYDQEKLYYDVADNVYLEGGLKEGVANNQEFIEEYASDNYRNKTADEVISDIIVKFDEEGTDYDEDKVREIVYGYYNKVGNQSLSLFRNGGAVRISNREARSYVQNRTPFRANNLSGENYGDIYVVKSYGYYPIFVYKDGVWYENSNKYSSSTAKQMGQSRPSSDTVKVSKGEIEGMYADGGNLASGWNYSIGGL